MHRNGARNKSIEKTTDDRMNNDKAATIMQMNNENLGDFGEGISPSKLELG